MKKTEFQFELFIAGGELAAVAHDLQTHLEALDGIDSSEVVINGRLIHLVLKVSFASANDAKKIHRIVMSELISNKNIEISQVSTTLTDIF